MGKAAASPSKRATHGGTTGSGSSSGMVTACGSTTPNTEDLLLTERPERVESTVVSRENATHLAFAASRTLAFPFAASSQYIRLLHDHCNSSDDPSGSSSALLVVVGPPGTGKSALLSHWAALRRTGGEDNGTHEFIYEHYCGCSFDSVKLSLFLFRLMHQLKTTFALRDFELPHEHEEEKLKFSLVRCLEAAVGRTTSTSRTGSGPSTKRRNIVLILDGIDCIRTEDGGDSLSWLPNTFPQGVRIIVSATHSGSGKSILASAQSIIRKPVVYDSDGDLIYDTSLPPSAHDSHTIRELRRRRHVNFVVVEPLDEISCRGILELYNRAATVQSPLTPEEQDAVVAAPGSANPLYLRLLLQGQELFETGSPDRAAWLERATSASEINGVYELLIRRWNDILVEDLNEQLHKLTSGSPNETAETASGEHKIVRRSTKRDMTDTTTTTTATNNSQSVHSGPLPLTRGSSVRAVHHMASPSPDPIELETLHIAKEQRVLLVRHTLSLLAVARYGLSETDLQRLLGDAVPRAISQQLLGLLSPHLMQIHRHDCGDNRVVLLDLSHNHLRLLVRYGYLRDDHLRTCYYKELANYFGGLEASQRRIDELPVQLERCAMWTSLQAALVDIKMFQLWWSERNREALFAYWRVLRANCSLHDPVDDFVRSLDEFIAHETPSADQLLALCLTITAFLRAWQRLDDGGRIRQLALARPAPPQLGAFIVSLGGQFSMVHLAEHDAVRVQHEIDALCLQGDDAYFVRRWLWTQFPLIAVAFESRFLRSLLAGKASSSVTVLDAAVARDEDSVSSSGSHTEGGGSVKGALQASGSGSSSSKKALVVLPKSLTAGKTQSPLKPAKRKPSLLFATGTNNAGDSVEDDGAFEFVSTENTELTVGSVAKYESQVMELRMKYDKLKFISKAKRDALKALASRLLDVRAQARAAGQSASHVEELLNQIRAIGDETLVGRQRGDYYKAILRHCEIHPARDANAIDVTETAVHKMKHEMLELQQKTQVLAYEARLASGESKKLHQVIRDKSQIHTTALERLRWRFELLQRMMMQQRKAVTGGGGTAAATKRMLRTRGDDDGEEDEEEDEEHDAEEEDAEGENNGRPRLSRKKSLMDDEQTTQFNRAKDKLLHKKETTLERLRKSESLKVYVGGPFRDDGVLGALRQVGINKPEEAQLYLQDQQHHAAQLEAEEKSLEQRVGDARDRLASLQAQLLNLKLGGGSSSRDAGGGGEFISGANSCGGATTASGSTPSSAVITSGAETTITTGGGSGGGASSHNLKQLEQQLSDALAITQQKKERAARARALSERLHLGLQHVAQLLGVTTTQQMESIELADSVEQVVRLYLGDEGHSQSTAATNIRRKNSVRAMGMAAAQSGLHGAMASPDARSPDEKRRFNLRVSRSLQRQMNPYVDGDAIKGPADDSDEDEDDDVDEDNAPSPRRTNQPQDVSTEPVTRRADIKNRARLEVERKQREATVSKASRDKHTSTKATTKHRKGT